MSVSEPLPQPADTVSLRPSAELRDRAASQRPRSERTRRRLLEAGRELFGGSGPREVTSHAIAARAGYAAGTFYLHFRDKLSLFRELAEEAASELERRLERAADRESAPPAVMRAQAEALAGFAQEHRDLLRIVFHPGSEAADVGAGILERLALGVSTRRREALDSGLACDCLHPEVLAQAVVGLWAHVLAWWSEDPMRVSREDLVRTLTHFQLHGDGLESGACCSLSPEEDSP